MKEQNIIAGRNAVLEALKSGRKIERILLARGAGVGVTKIRNEAEKRRVPLKEEDRKVLDGIYTGAHQGVIAIAGAFEYADTEGILAKARKAGKDPFVIVLDGIEDPHNLGAIIRTAECAGVDGVIIAKNRAAQIGETVSKTSAGALEYVPVARETNMARTIEKLKDEGIWTYALDMDGETYTGVDLKGPCAIVIGSEGRGISRLVKEKCDFVLSIPMSGQISSLNASNAAAILMYEIVRQRGDAE